MAIKFVSIKCPECGSILDIEEGRKQIYCSYCGAHIMVQNDNEYIFRQVDEAAVKRAEATMRRTDAETMIQLKKMENEENESKRKRKAYYIAYTIAGILFVLGMLIGQVIEDAWSLSCIGLLIAVFAFDKNMEDKDDAKRQTPLYDYETRISSDMYHYENKNVDTIESLYYAAGFTNITTVPLHDLGMFSRKNGLVKDIEIGGDDNFRCDDIFNKDTYVVIKYHSYKR